MERVKTLVVPVSHKSPEDKIINNAVAILQRGGLVAFPTETVYGLGADALNSAAVAGVFTAKGRPADNPLIVHLASIQQLGEVGKEISRTAYVLAETFWPGPLTLVVKSKNIFPPIVTAGLETVAVRVPNHPVPLALIRGLTHGIVGPSANLSGKPSPTTAQHVYDDLNGKIEMILDTGPTKIGLESTVIDVTTEIPTILRQGGLMLEDIERVAGKVDVVSDKALLKRSPGTRHRHYAPNARVILIGENNIDELKKTYTNHKDRGETVGVIVHGEKIIREWTESLGIVLPNQLEKFSAQLFAAMRMLDDRGADIILIEAVTEAGLGKTIMDRLKRSAEKPE